MNDQVKERLYSCNQCQRKFLTSKLLVIHERTHNIARPYRCNDCHERFKQLVDLLLHQSTHEGDDTSDSRILKKLSENVHNPKQPSIKSPIGKTTFSSDKGALNPLKSKTGVRPYSCLKCNKSFEFKLDRHEHECSQIVTGTQVGSRFKEKHLEHLENRQIITDSNKRTFACDGLDMKSERVIDSRKQTHRAPQRNSSQHLNKNQLLKTRRCSKKCFPCAKCSKQYTRMEHLRRHLRSHSNEKPHVCVKCKKNFALAHQLKAHALTHSGERPYGCKSCDKQFRQLSHLITHRRVHTGERPYACKICDKTFSDLSCFRVHGLIHTGVQLYKCETCRRSFKTGQKLRRHELIHISETTTYECEQCDKKFRHKSNLLSHQQIHSKNTEITSTKRLNDTIGLHRHGNSDDKVRPISERRSSRSVTEKAFPDVASVSTRRLKCKTMESPHECKVCAKSFGRSSLLCRHELIHIREAAHECKKLRFADKTSLLLHEKSHYKENDQILRDSFVSLSSTSLEWRWCKGVNIQRFLSTLVTSSFFVCTSCNVLFRKRVSLDKHLRSTSVVTYGCGICGELSDKKSLAKVCFYSHLEDSNSSSGCFVTHASSDFDFGALKVIGSVEIIQVKEEQSIFTRCENNNLISKEHSYALSNKLACTVPEMKVDLL